MVITCAIIGLILLMWFRTDVWLEYCRLFRLDVISYYKDFDKKRQQDITLTYHIYLRRYHNAFFTRLITCPICLSVWLGIIAILLQSGIFFMLALTSSIGFIAILLTVISILFDLPLFILGGLAVYAIFDRLLG